MDKLQMVHVLVAFGGGWAQLIGPLAPEIEVGRSVSIGGCGAVGNSTASGDNKNTGDTQQDNLTGSETVSLGLLCESRTQVWGTTKYISGEIGEQG
jgi:hypothetical protein